MGCLQAGKPRKPRKRGLAYKSASPQAEEARLVVISSHANLPSNLAGGEPCVVYVDVPLTLSDGPQGSRQIAGRDSLGRRPDDVGRSDRADNRPTG